MILLCGTWYVWAWECVCCGGLSDVNGSTNALKHFSIDFSYWISQSENSVQKRSVETNKKYVRKPDLGFLKKARFGLQSKKAVSD